MDPVTVIFKLFLIALTSALALGGIVFDYSKNKFVAKGSKAKWAVSVIFIVLIITSFLEIKSQKDVAQAKEAADSTQAHSRETA